MSSCKLTDEQPKKMRKIITVTIDLRDCNDYFIENNIKELRKIDYHWTCELADIIENK